MRTIEDPADLFAAEGEGAKGVLEELKTEAEDALDLALSEAPEGSQRGRYLHATGQIFPLLLGLEDEGERAAALGDVANRMKLGKRDLRTAFARFESQARPEQEDTEADGGLTLEELGPEPGTERHELAMGLLRCPDILGRAARDMELLGFVGEPTAKKLLFVCAISASAGPAIQPSIHAESSSGKNFLADTVLSLLPPEKVIKRSAISAKALYRTQESLAGRVLYLQEHSGSEDADFTFRVMQSDGKLVYEATEPGPDGGFRTVVHEKEGPLVIVQTTTELRLFDENATRVFAIYLDESAEQTERVVRSALAKAADGGISEEERAAILEAWHDAIRLLEAAEVIVPYAERIVAPSRLVRMRRDINRLLDAIRVLAWLHQHDRERDGLGRVLAAEADFHMALELVRDSLLRAWESLTPAEEAVLGAIKSLPEAARKNGFARNDLSVGDVDARRVQGALKALTESGYLERDGRRGPQGYRYTVSRDPESKGLGISLRPPDDVGEGAGPEGHEADVGVDPAQDVEQDEEGDGSRGIARIEPRAIEAPPSPREDAGAPSRGADGAGHLGDDEHEEGGEVDHLGGLTKLGWYRAQTVFPVEGGPEDGLLDTDPVARKLRHEVGIYRGRDWWSGVYGNPTPLAATAEDLFAAWSGGGAEGDRATAPWPRTPEEMADRLERVIPLLQAEAHPFWDPGFSDWYASMALHHPSDTEEVCKEAHLRAERWRREGTGEEIWALVALREGWRVPDREIEEVVWSRATRDPTEEVAPEGPDEAFEF